MFARHLTARLKPVRFPPTARLKRVRKDGMPTTPSFRSACFWHEESVFLWHPCRKANPSSSKVRVWDEQWQNLSANLDTPATMQRLKCASSYCCPCGRVVNWRTLLDAAVPVPCPWPESTVK